MAALISNLDIKKQIGEKLITTQHSQIMLLKGVKNVNLLSNIIGCITYNKFFLG